MDPDGSKTSLLILFVVLMVMVGCGFFLPLANWGWIGGVLKGLLFIATGVVLYGLHFGDVASITLWRRAEPDPENDQEAEDRAADSSVNPWSGFGHAFDKYRDEALRLIQQALVSPQVGFYLIRNGRLVFQAGLDQRGLIHDSFVVTDEDPTFEVASTCTARLLETLPEGCFADGFPGLALKSFVGVPLALGDECLGVLAAGSDAAEHFSETDLEILTQFGRLMMQVMTLCHRGLRWEMDQEVYQVHVELEKQLEFCHDEESVMGVFLTHVKKLFPMDRFALCVDAGGEGEIRFVYGQVDHLDKGTRFPLDGGLNGWLIKRNAPLIIQDIEEGRYIRPRYFADEDSKHGMHAFLGTPLNGGRDQAWGCISLESKQTGQYSAKAKDVLTILAIPLQLALERLRLPQQEHFNNQQPFE